MNTSGKGLQSASMYLYANKVTARANYLLKGRAMQVINVAVSEAPAGSSL